MNNNQRIRADLKVIREVGGFRWDHTGTRQSSEFLLVDVRTGAEYIFDSFADRAAWCVGSIHRVSFTVQVDGNQISNPRPVKSL